MAALRINAMNFPNMVAAATYRSVQDTGPPSMNVLYRLKIAT